MISMFTELRSRYLALFGHEPVKPAALESIEGRLQVRLPSDFKEISSFYSGGILGGIAHYAIDNGGDCDNVVDETLRIRATAGIPHSMVIIAEPPESLIVLDTNSATNHPAVIWCDAFDVGRLDHAASLSKPTIWPTYLDFFRYLLDCEEEERSKKLT